MQTWGDAYRRLRLQRRFRAWFGNGVDVPGPNDFTAKTFVLPFTQVTGRTDTPLRTAPVFGPQQIIFDKGAIVLGITSGAYAAQIDPTASHVLPTTASGRRDIYRLYIAYTDDQDLTVPGSTIDPVFGAAMNVQAFVNANALQGDGTKDEFPRDLIVPPSTGFNVSAQSMQPATLPGGAGPIAVPALFIHVVFHCVIPKG